MSFNISKYFWDLNDKALKETEVILKNPIHPKFVIRMSALLSRCDQPKEIFSFIPKELFIESWPKVQTYWRKIGQSPDFRNWWQSIYEQISQKNKIGKKINKGIPSLLFLKIGRMVREARVNKRLSQKELAVRTGMKQPDISGIEEGRKNITIRTLASLCKTLEIKKIDFS
ncbi:MAG: helix-turn-helix transcriptional regulator [Candidatus Omnitrophota bacterium]